MLTPTSLANKIPLDEFLKVLSSTGIGIQRAMAITSKVYKSHNTVSALGKLTDEELRALGVDKQEDRRDTLAAFRKAGYRSAALEGSTAAGGGLATTRRKEDEGAKTIVRTPSNLHTSQKKQRKSPLKRKRGELHDDYALESDTLPYSTTAGLSANKSVQEVDNYEFNEILDPEALRSRFVVINRAPVMAAWATVVAERLGFKRDEALSIASAYTEANAISKGISLGVFEKGKGRGMEFARGEAQPYVELMGRRPVYQSQSGRWRALLNNDPVEPASTHSYMRRSFRQTLPYTIGAMRLLAQSFHTSNELNEKGYALYTAFRPSAGKWGERAQMRLADILDLRKNGKEGEGEGSDDKDEDRKAESVADVLGIGTRKQEAEAETETETETGEPSVKKPRYGTSADSFISVLLKSDKDPLVYEDEL